MVKKVILITGANSGIGYAILKTLIKQNYSVYGTARSTGGLEKITKAGGHALRVEMTNEKSLTNAVETILKSHNTVDVLVNNAGYGLYGTVEEVPIKDAKDQFEVNLFGLARLTQLVLPAMRDANSGTIINMSSMAGKMYTPFGAWYHASKHALEGWSDCLRLEVKPFGINVVIIEPGTIRTSWGVTMQNNLHKYSAKGPYGKYVHKMLKTSSDAYSDSAGSPPELIADLVYKAIISKNPKTRYIGGKNARLLVFIRTKLGDRIYDKIISRATS